MGCNGSKNNLKTDGKHTPLVNDEANRPGQSERFIEKPPPAAEKPPPAKPPEIKQVQERPPSELAPAPAVKPPVEFALESFCEGLWDGEWEEGVVERKNTDGTYEVVWTADDTSTTLGVQEMRPRSVMDEDNELLAKYSLGKLLGQGGFGIVYLCVHKETRETLAVKLIDRIESEPDEIEDEIHMLKTLAHPNVSELREVFYEKLFVCLVLVMYAGGDLINGINVVLDAYEKFPRYKTRNVMKQCFEGINWLHSQGYIHRDVKGDNFLTDRKDISDPKVKVVLSDLGTVIWQEPKERCEETAGTKLYWAPELYKGSYGAKNDVWAMGVVLCCMLKGTLPFDSELDIRRKKIKWQQKEPAACIDFVQGLLSRDEKTRFDSPTCLKHPWLDLAQFEKEAKEEKIGPSADSESDADSFLPTDSDEECRIANTAVRLSVRRGSNASALLKGKLGGKRSSGAGGKGRLKAEPINEGAAERRKELMQRLQDQHDVKQPNVIVTRDLPLEAFLNSSSITVESKNSDILVKYEWRNGDEIKEAFELDTKTTQSARITLQKGGRTRLVDDAKPCQSETIQRMLKENNIDISKFGTVRGSSSIEDFVEEVQSGASRIMLDATKHKRIVRVVDIVLLRLTHGDGANLKYLVRRSKLQANGEVSKDAPEMEGSKKEPHENTIQAGERVLTERLNLDIAKVTMELHKKEYVETEEESRSYPGVFTLYRKEILPCKIIGKTAPNTKTEKGVSVYTSVDSKKQSRVYEWLCERECQALSIKLKAPKQKTHVSSLIEPSIGFREDELKAYLLKHNVDISKYGVPPHKTLAELSTELLTGESSLQIQKDGAVARIVDKVILKIIKPSGPGKGEVLVQSEQICGGSKKALNRLPVVARRPDENVFVAAQRLLTKTLRMNANYVTIDAHDVKDQYQQMTSLSFPGLVTRCRKRVIVASLNIDKQGNAIGSVACEKRASVVVNDKDPSVNPARKPVKSGKLPVKTKQATGAKGAGADGMAPTASKASKAAPADAMGKSGSKAAKKSNAPAKAKKSGKVDLE